MTTLLPASERQQADTVCGADGLSLRGGQKEVLAVADKRVPFGKSVDLRSRQ
jgi:hypothetical protein